MGLIQTKIEISIETSAQLIESLHMAREVALKSDVAEVLPAHLVLAMLEDDESSFLLDAYGVDFNKIRIQLGKIVQKQIKPKSRDRHAVFSAGIELIMQHAREQAQKNALAEVDSNLILAVILSEQAGFLGGLLAPYDLDTSGVLQYLELREGKTVNIDPLPSMQKPVNNTKINAQSPAQTPAPHRKPAPAPSRQAPPIPPTRTGAPAVNVAMPGLRPQPQNPQGQQSAASVGTPSHAIPRTNAPIQNAPPSPAHPNAMPPNPASPTRTKVMPPEQNLSELSRQPNAGSGGGFKSGPKDGSSTRSSATPAAATPTPPAPSQNAPSGLRSVFSGLGKKLKGAASKSQNAAAPTILPPTPANNNQSPAAANTTPVPPQGPAMTREPAPTSMPQRFSPAQAPLAATVDQLVDPASSGQAGTAPTPHSTVPMNQPNRPVKRRRAVPSSLGSNESLSATGSVLEKGRLVEAVPRKMTMNKPSRAEVRITREQLDEINSEFEDLSSSHIHDLAVTEAMTVQLRAPGSGFHIENLSPQTQWIDRNQRHINDADFGVWRWNVTPIKSGKSRLQLVISARTVDDDGNIHIADIPDKIIELSIAKDHGKGLKNLAFIAFLVISSLALGRYGEAAWQWAVAFVSKLGL